MAQSKAFPVDGAGAAGTDSEVPASSSGVRFGALQPFPQDRLGHWLARSPGCGSRFRPSTFRGQRQIAANCQTRV